MIEKTYKKYKNSVNMTYSELLAWSNNPCSKKASIDRSPINRNLELLSTPKSDWTKKHIKWAKKTISFVARMKKVNAGRPICNGLSKRTISLKNWAYNPNKR